MRIWAVTLALSLSLCAFEAEAAKSDIMPPPQKAPRIPVAKEPLKEPKEAHEYEGKAKAIDGERLLIGEKEIRLFGIVTPSITSNYGPQARQRLDQIVKDNAVLCKVTDKDREGRPVAFCGTVDIPDISYEMLRQGWAMADAKALKNNSLAGVYQKVEQEAQSLNKGLFAPMPMVQSVPVSNPSNTLIVPLASAPTQKAEEPKVEQAMPTPVITLGAGQPIITSRTEQQKAADKQVDKQPEAAKPSIASDNVAEDGKPFIERYQGILASMFWFFGAFGLGGMLLLRDKGRLKERRRALAAALHGELTAARHICRTKARELKRQHRVREEGAARPSQFWPKMRSFVYQAHVGSIGLLGSELARRVASVYGQCADYAVYYQQTAMQKLPSAVAVSETLSTLADHMDVILECLVQVEETGRVYVPEPIEEVAVTDEDVQETGAQQPVVDEEAKVIKARFERMAQSMVGMLGRKRDVQYTGDIVEQNKIAAGEASATKHASEAAE